MSSIIFVDYRFVLHACIYWQENLTASNAGLHVCRTCQRFESNLCNKSFITHQFEIHTIASLPWGVVLRKPESITQQSFINALRLEDAD